MISITNNQLDEQSKSFIILSNTLQLDSHPSDDGREEPLSLSLSLRVTYDIR